MINKKDLPKKIPVFPLRILLSFPKTTVPLNIFEPRYIDMVNDSMKQEKFIGMIQPRNQKSLMAITMLSTKLDVWKNYQFY